MVSEERIRIWKKDEDAHFAGWDFSYIKDRMTDQVVPWNYVALAKPLVRKSTSLLEMGTGGGEVFSQLAPFPRHTVAIEGYRPNVQVATRRLRPLGVQVIEAKSDDILPFADNAFDLVVNQHSGYIVEELARVIRRDGQFFTQQVGYDNLEDLRAVFDQESSRYTFNSLEYKIPEFERNRFTIIYSKNWSGKVTFSDVGAVTYFLKTVPWIVDNFGVDSHRVYLERMQRKLDRGETLQFTYTRHIIHARKD